MPDQFSQSIALRSEEVQEILSRVPHWMIRWGNVLFLLLILLLPGITWFVKYPDIISSQALLTTEIPPHKVYAKMTGKLDSIGVEENQMVLPGQVLGILENTANDEDVFKLKAIVDSLQYNSLSFSFPFEDLGLLFLGDIEMYYALFENAYIQYMLNKKLQPFSSEALANKYTLSELQQRQKNLLNQKEINLLELALIEKDLEREKVLFESGAISASEYENKQLAYNQALRNFKNFETSISQIREGIRKNQMNAEGIEINRAKEEITLLKNVIQTYNQLKKAIKDWEQKYVLQSRIKGKVALLNYWTVHQTVQQGDLVFTVIPAENETFVTKLKTPAQNSGKIKLGQEVNIKLDNYPDSEFGVLRGKVENISAIPDGEGMYLIDASLPENLITSYNKQITFKQEMVGTAEIITEDLRLFERFFYQLRKAINRN